MTKAEVLAELAKGEGCLAHSADDEPIFILCARDILAPIKVRSWANDLEVFIAKAEKCGLVVTGRTREKIVTARVIARRMDEWQAKHYAKMPGA